MRPQESQTFKHHLLPWVSGRNHPPFLLLPAAQAESLCCGVPHTPPPACGAALAAVSDTAYLALFFQLLTGKRHGPVRQSTVPVYPTTTGLSLFTILEEKIWGEDPCLDRWWLTSPHYL